MFVFICLGGCAARTGPACGWAGGVAALPCILSITQYCLIIFSLFFFFCLPMKKIVLIENAKGLVDSHGVEKCGFLTLTFPDNVICPREASRRFNSFRQLFNVLGIGQYICVQERHKSGRIHYHLIVAMDKDIKGRMSDKQIRAHLWGAASRNLREKWGMLNTLVKGYGFGRVNLMPLYGSGINCALYLSKYLSKGDRSPLDKGVRLVRFGLKKRFCSSSVTYVDSYFRRACCILFGDIDVRAHVGSRWAYLLRPAIQLAIDAIKGLRVLTQLDIDSIRNYIYYGSKLYSFSSFQKHLTNRLGVSND